MQIANSDEDLLWGVDDNSIKYCSNDLKKLPGVVQSTSERSSKFKKNSLYSSLSKNSRKPIKPINFWPLKAGSLLI